ncbi:MAG TPA: class I SAM-dependent methyltransferase [Chloroflexia bacterium]|nr:class I SAM-dependent methyltransferase [Chloroflexia bacterium]
MPYSGTFYEPIGDFLGEKYLDFNFTHGTQHEVDFLLELLQLPKGSTILDIGSGPGRHSLELARRGYRTFGIDISSAFIEIARAQAQAENLPARFQITDARQLAFKHEFEAAICLCEGAFGLAGDENGHRQILAGIYQALKPGALFVLTALNAFYTARYLTSQSKFDPYTSTEEQQQVFTNPQGESREVTIYTTSFTFRELKFLLEEAGFKVEAGYGCIAGSFSRKPLTIEDFEVMMVSRRL